MSMKQQWLEERPRERCLKSGPDVLSLRECLALLLGSGPPGMGCLGLAHRLLERSLGRAPIPEKNFEAKEESNSEAVFLYSESEWVSHFFQAWEVHPEALLADLSGLGRAKKAQLLAAFQLAKKYHAYRSQKQQAALDLKILSTTESAEDLLKQQAVKKIESRHRFAAQEWLGFVSVFSGPQLGSFCIVERGARTHVNVDPIELFAQILSQRPVGFFLFHNHPSGNLTPSFADHELTQRVQEVSERLGLYFLGHAVVSIESEHWIHLHLS